MIGYISAADPLAEEMNASGLPACRVTIRIGKDSKTLCFRSLNDAFKALEGMEPSDIDGFTVDINRNVLPRKERHAWPWQT